MDCEPKDLVRDFRDFDPCMMLGRLGRYLLPGPGSGALSRQRPEPGPSTT